MESRTSCPEREVWEGAVELGEESRELLTIMSEAGHGTRSLGAQQGTDIVVVSEEEAT